MPEKTSLFIDEPALENIVLDFPIYIKTLSNLVLNSKPNYTVGIYGSWGTGKTTLMKNVMSELTTNGCLCFEFNAWRYSHEERHATFPLMLNVLTNILKQEGVKRSIRGSRRLLSALIRVAKGLSGSIKSGVPGMFEAELNFDIEKMLSDENEISKLTEKTKPVLQEGIELIGELKSNIDGPNNNPDLKLVVFIDDLDRCTPEKATEIFESVKIFFDIPGFVFVFGLSQEVIEAAIDYKYQHFNGKFNGKDYLKKIIQVPFPLPKWTSGDIVQFLQKLIEKYPNNYHKQFFKDNIGLIAKSTEKNPREVKRLLNNFIISYENHKHNVDIDRTKLFLLHVVVNRWPEFYNDHMLHPYTLNNIRTRWNRIVDQVPDEEHQLDFDMDALINKDLTLKSITDLSSIMDFLEDSGLPLLTMEEDEWKEYRRATIIEPITIVDKNKKIMGTSSDIIKNNPTMHFTDLTDTPLKQEQFWKYGGSIEKGPMPEDLAQTFLFSSKKDHEFKFQYFVPVDFGHDKISHSSDLLLHIKIDGLEIGSVELGHKNREPSLRLNTGIISIRGVSLGKHTLTLQPETRANYLDSWGGTIAFY